MVDLRIRPTAKSGPFTMTPAPSVGMREKERSTLHLAELP